MLEQRPAPAADAQLNVADAMLTRPIVHGPWTTVGELRALFEDEHVHAALIVYAGKLVGVVERGDLADAGGDGTAALAIAKLEGRAIGPDVPLSRARRMMDGARRRRLAVAGEHSTLLGLLCLKADGSGFCSDADMASRRQDG